MKNLQPTEACCVCFEGFDDMPDSDDYEMNLEYWQEHKPVGEAERIEWDKQRPVITHAIGKVKNSDVANKIHWMCYSCLHKLNPETGKHFIAECPVCKIAIVNRGNIQHVAAELTGLFAIPRPYYAHPHPESFENVSNRWWQEMRPIELAARRVREQQDRDGERLAQLIDQQQREQAVIDRQEQEHKEHERVFEEQQRLMLRKRQHQQEQFAEQQRLQQKREQRHIMMLRLAETQRLQLEQAREEAQRKAAAKQKPRKNSTVYLQWIND